MLKRHIWKVLPVAILSACSLSGGSQLYVSKPTNDRDWVKNVDQSENNIKSRFASVSSMDYKSAQGKTLADVNFGHDRLVGTPVYNQNNSFGDHKRFGPAVATGVASTVEYWLIRAVKEYVESQVLGLNGQSASEPNEFYPFLYGGKKTEYKEMFNFANQFNETSYDLLKAHLEQNKFKTRRPDIGLYRPAKRDPIENTKHYFLGNRRHEVSRLLASHINTWVGRGYYIMEVNGEKMPHPHQTTFDEVERLINESDFLTREDTKLHAQKVLELVAKDRAKLIEEEDNTQVDHYVNRGKPATWLRPLMVDMVLSNCYPRVHHHIKGIDLRYNRHKVFKADKCLWSLEAAGVDITGLRITKSEYYAKPHVFKTVKLDAESIDRGMWHMMGFWRDRAIEQGLTKAAITDVQQKAFTGLVSAERADYLINRSENKQYKLALSNGRWTKRTVNQYENDAKFALNSLKSMFDAPWYNLEHYGPVEGRMGVQIHMRSDPRHAKLKPSLFDNCVPAKERSIMFVSAVRLKLNCGKDIVKKSRWSNVPYQGSYLNSTVTYSVLNDDQYLRSGQRLTSEGLNAYAFVEVHKNSIKETKSHDNRNYRSDEMKGGTNRVVSQQEMTDYLIKNSQWGDFISWTSFSKDGSRIVVTGHVFFYGVEYQFDLSEVLTRWMLLFHRDQYAQLLGDK